MLPHKENNLKQIIKDNRHKEIKYSDRVYIIYSSENKEDSLTGDFFIPLEDAEVIITIKGKVLEKLSYKDLMIFRRKMYRVFHNFFNGIFDKFFDDIVFKRRNKD